MKYKSWITTALLGAAVGLSAQSNHTGINLSLWKNIATQPIDSTQTSCFNLGFQSTMNKLNGLSFSIFPSVVHKDMNGVQFSGITNMVGGSMRGLQLSAISNINGNNLSGLSATGLVNITGNHAQGVLLSGLTNITGDQTHGLAISGLLNISGDETIGLQLAGLANITGKSFRGVATAGLLNIAGGDLDGVQLSGLANITTEQLNGTQIGLLNYATQANGLQIGLVNYYEKDFKGFQLGLANLNPHTKIQFMLFGGNETKLNMAVRFKNEKFYTIVGGGTHYLDFSDQFSAALSYRGGVWFPIYKSLTISGDLGYQHIETCKNKSNEIPARLYALQARINLELQLTTRFGLFVTGGYSGSRHYNQNKTFDKGILIEGGIILF